MAGHTEPTIAINGHVLTEGQAMIVRCAVEAFASDLAENGLGDDDDGMAVTDRYQRRLAEIRRFIFDVNRDADAAGSQDGAA